MGEKVESTPAASPAASQPAASAPTPGESSKDALRGADFDRQVEMLAPPSPDGPSYPMRPTDADLKAAAARVVRRAEGWVEDLDRFGVDISTDLGVGPLDLDLGARTTLRNDAEVQAVLTSGGPNAGVKAASWPEARRANIEKVSRSLPPWLFYGRHIVDGSFFGGGVKVHRDVVSDLSRIEARARTRAAEAGAEYKPPRPGSSFRYQEKIVGGRHPMGAAVDFRAGTNPMFYADPSKDGTGVLVSAIADEDVNRRDNMPSHDVLAAQRNAAAAHEGDGAFPEVIPKRGGAEASVVAKTQAAFDRLTRAEAALQAFWAENDGRNKNAEEVEALVTPRIKTWLARHEREDAEIKAQLDTIKSELKTAEATVKATKLARRGKARDTAIAQRMAAEQEKDPEGPLLDVAQVVALIEAEHESAAAEVKRLKTEQQATAARSRDKERVDRLKNIRGTLRKLESTDSPRPLTQNQARQEAANKEKLFGRKSKLAAGSPGLTQVAEHGLLDLPQWFVMAFADCGWLWGGAFSSPDPMHFETVAPLAGTNGGGGGVSDDK